MQTPFAIAAAILLAGSLPLAACGEGSEAGAIGPSRPAVTAPSAARGGAAAPRERAVLAAMDAFKQAILDRDTAELARTWTEDYTFINPQGGLVTREQRLANLGSGSTNVQVIENEREITVRLYGDAAVVQNLSTLRGSFSGSPTDTDLRGTFVWVRREGRWQLVTNQLTPVTP